MASKEQGLKEALAQWLADNQGGKTSPIYASAWMDTAKRILSFLKSNGCVVKAGDQTLPSDPTHTSNCFRDKEFHACKTGYFACGQDAIKAGFVKVVELV